MRPLTSENVIHFLQQVHREVEARRDELTRLDAAIGDADHGTNMHRGFAAVLEQLPQLAGKDVATVLKSTGMTLIASVGGAAGPLYGTAFIRAGIVLAQRADPTVDDMIAAGEAALEGIQARGHAQVGEKTMVDTIAPALQTLKVELDRGVDLQSALNAAVAAAESGMKATIPMRATKGRASYLGERSVGHQDPGATSAHLIVRVMYEVFQG
jgi:phosphoenolpyruvate---glycerone phosphotransferase subunit DhaL